MMYLPPPLRLYRPDAVLRPDLEVLRDEARAKAKARIAAAAKRGDEAVRLWRYFRNQDVWLVLPFLSGPPTDGQLQVWADNLGGWLAALETVITERLYLPEDLGWCCTLFPNPFPGAAKIAASYTHPQPPLTYAPGGWDWDDPGRCTERHGRDLIIACRHKLDPCTPQEQADCSECGLCTHCAADRDAAARGGSPPA